MSQTDSKTKRIFTDPIKRRAWVKYQIHLQGRSMAEIAADAGVDRRSLYTAFCRPYPRMEKVIADTVGLSPQVLFPDRYDADGLPNRPRGRPKDAVKSTSKNAGRSQKRAECA